MRRNLIIAIALVTLASLTVTARTYSNADGSYGIAWDAGGVSVENSTPSLFICPAVGHMNNAGEWVQDWTNPIAPFFPDLVTDC